MSNLTKKTSLNYFLRNFFSDPFGDFESFFDPIFKNFLGHYERMGCCDFEKTSDEYIIYVDVPGLKKDEISIEIDNRLLTIKGERKPKEKKENSEYLIAERTYRRFERVFTLPEDVIIDNPEAKLEDGILILIFKRKNDKKNIKVIDIK